MISLNYKGKLKIHPQKAVITTEVSSLLGVKLFCKVKLGKQVKDGHTDSSGGLTPNWTHSILTFFINGEDATLIQVYQKGLFDNTLIGEAKIALNLIFQNKYVNSKFILFKDQKKVGEITVDFTFEPEQANTFTNIIIAGSSQNTYYGNPFLVQPQNNVMMNYYNPNQFLVQSQTNFVPQNNNNVLENNEKYKDISQEEDPNIQDTELCIVCLTNKRAGAFYKCGHNCCCNSCGKTFIGKNCPLCREAVYDYIKIFTP